MGTESEESCEFAQSVENARQALAYCLCNKFTHAENFLKELDEKYMYHVISRATISYLQAMFTYERQLIDIAYEKVKNASHVCDSYRKKHSLGEIVSNWIGRTSFQDFSEIELHAELCYAECLLERAMLTFIQDENLISFIKGGLKIRSAYSIYRNCMHVLQEHPKLFESSKNKADFESGVYMGMGSFNVLLSLLPARILRLLEWVGFAGNKKNGLNWLDQGVHVNGLRSPMCTITLLGYQVVAVPMLGIGDTDVPYVNKILDSQLDKFPDGSIFLYFSGRLKQSQGLIKEALVEYEKAVSVSIDWHQVHHICYWEMMWCYSFQGQWDLASRYAKLLSTESKWSKCSYMYMHAAFLIMHQFELKHSGDKDKIKEAHEMSDVIDDLLGKVRKYKQRIAGKSIPFEKFSITRVDKYNTTGSLVLPGLEIIHLWNGFSMFYKDKKTIEHFLHLATLALAELKEPEGLPKEHHDNVCLCLMLKGICLRHLNRYDEAEEMLKSVAASPLMSHSSKMDSYLPPYASAELGAMYAGLGWKEKALEQYENTLKKYDKYGLESRLHFRVHSGIEVIKEAIKEKVEKCSNSSVDSSNEDEFYDVEETLSVISEADAEREYHSKAAVIMEDIVISNGSSKVGEAVSNGIDEGNVTVNGMCGCEINSNDSFEDHRVELNCQGNHHDFNDVEDERKNIANGFHVEPSKDILLIGQVESLSPSSSSPAVVLTSDPCQFELSDGIGVNTNKSNSQHMTDKKDKKSRFSMRSWFHKSSAPKQSVSHMNGSSLSLSEASSNVSPLHLYKVRSTGQLVDRQTGL